MRKTTISHLKSCAKDLIEVRAQLTSNLEPSMIALFALFDNVVKRLEQCEAVVDDRAGVMALIRDGLQLAAVIAELVKSHCG